jgi:hypothetical protein
VCDNEWAPKLSTSCSNLMGHSKNRHPAGACEIQGRRPTGSCGDSFRQLSALFCHLSLAGRMQDASMKGSSEPPVTEPDPKTEGWWFPAPLMNGVSLRVLEV